VESLHKAGVLLALDGLHPGTGPPFRRHGTDDKYREVLGLYLKRPYTVSQLPPLLILGALTDAKTSTLIFPRDRTPHVGSRGTNLYECGPKFWGLEGGILRPPFSLSSCDPYTSAIIPLV
jgi:hypothetical protein